MRHNASGMNMLDVKIKNRSAILNVIYQSDGISRKDIASTLGLTPAAITLITTDLIKEGVLSESTADGNNFRKGRKEVLLKINKKKYAAIGVYITRHKFRMLCIDLDNHILFEDTVYTDDCNKNYTMILDKLCRCLEAHLHSNHILDNYALIGMGISTNGIVDSMEGVSLRSYGIWERNVPVISYLYKKLQMPLLLTNNICSLAHGEYFLSHMDHPDDMLFIKYGPGVGAARLVYENFFNIFNFQAVELGHVIVEPSGAPCICGNVGCLETIASYDSIESAIKNVMSTDTTPKLYELTDGKPENISMEQVVKAYDLGDIAVVAAVNRAVHFLALSIRNAMCMFAPKKIVLYGELFEHPSIKQELRNQLSHYTETQIVRFSHYNLQLDLLGPATTIIQNFFQNGGKL